MPSRRSPDPATAVARRASFSRDVQKVFCPDKWEGEPECLVAFDECGGLANVDVLLSVRDEHGPLVVAVEAKADETFGPLVGRALTDAIDRKLANVASKG
jgi:hypothetical protein